MLTHHLRSIASTVKYIIIHSSNDYGLTLYDGDVANVSGDNGAGEEDEAVGAVCELRDDVGSLEEVILTHNAFIRKVASEAGIR